MQLTCCRFPDGANRNGIILRNEMAVILQTAWVNAFSWKKNAVLCFQFYKYFSGVPINKKRGLVKTNGLALNRRKAMTWKSRLKKFVDGLITSISVAVKRLNCVVQNNIRNSISHKTWQTVEANLTDAFQTWRQGPDSNVIYHCNDDAWRYCVSN